MKSLLIVALLLFAPGAAAQVNRCIIDGKAVYTDLPCLQTGETVGQALERRQAASAEAARAQEECNAWLATDPTVRNSGWDASVDQVETWLKRNINDPASLVFVAWSKVHRSCDGYIVNVRFRARNAFGGIITQSRQFTLDRDGEVITVRETAWSPR